MKVAADFVRSDDYYGRGIKAAGGVRLLKSGSGAWLCGESIVTLRQTMERLRSEADLDHLTGLANRRRFRVALNREVERWRRYGVPCALLLLDIDHMKAINDRFGHPTGDSVIRQIASVLTKVLRDNDTAARLGGEEFALLLAILKAKQRRRRTPAIFCQADIPEFEISPSHLRGGLPRTCDYGAALTRADRLVTLPE